jgi:pimeloyl-ACP methyl ester carboxylesterase
MSQEQHTVEAATPVAAPRLVERGVMVKGLRIATVMTDTPRELWVRAPLVVLPAAGHSWDDYRALLERYTPTRRVFALDWPGFGHSARPAPADFAYSSAGYAELLAGWLDGLGIARAVLLGHAVGAAVAVRYAAAHPRRVLALALVAPGGFTPPGRWRTLACRLLGTPALLRRLEAPLTSLYLGPAVPESQAILERQRQARTAPDAEARVQASAALWRSFAASDADVLRLARQVDTPALVVRGALDPLITERDARRAATSLNEGRGALEVVLPGAGHLPFLQQPARFFQALDGLLATADLRTLERA